MLPLFSLFCLPISISRTIFSQPPIKKSDIPFPIQLHPPKFKYFLLFKKPDNKILINNKHKQMEINKNKNALSLQIISSTWLKNSHSLYDYQSQKLQPASFSFPTTCKSISIYRKRQSPIVQAIDQSSSQQLDLSQYQFLTRFQLKKQAGNKLKLAFQNSHTAKQKKNQKQRQNTDQSNFANEDNQQQTYLVVKKIKDQNNEPQGHKLQVDQIIKLGRVEYIVSQIKQNGNITRSKNKKIYANLFNSKIFKIQHNYQKGFKKNLCKICLDQSQTNNNFLFNPCLCSGSCGTVHIECLMQWINVKVKKQTIGGTAHFNFNKFQCQVCKSQLPMTIQIHNTYKQLLPIEKPEGVSDKVKSVMLIQNTPLNGIKLGRGHECQIRITDISVSRQHAYIKTIGNNFYIYDSKSKFGTLVRSQSLNFLLQLDKISRVIQIGRTILTLEIHKKSTNTSLS